MATHPFSWWGIYGPALRKIILGEAATSLYVFKQTATLLPVISVPGMAVIEI